MDTLIDRLAQRWGNSVKKARSTIEIDLRKEWYIFKMYRYVSKTLNDTEYELTLWKCDKAEIYAIAKHQNSIEVFDHRHTNQSEYRILSRTEAIHRFDGLVAVSKFIEGESSDG